MSGQTNSFQLHPSLKSWESPSDCPKVSFCISYKNRFEQISQTLLRNLEDNAADQARVEFVVADFDASDPFQGWALDNCRPALERGYLKIFSSNSLPRFHCSVAKNTAHRVANGLILTNLDADNLTGPAGGRYVYDALRRLRFRGVLHQWSGQWNDGSCGRISCLAQDFLGIGGYDESFAPAGYQDLDLLERLQHGCSLKKTTGLNFFQRLVQRRLSDPIYAGAIPNSKSATMQDHEGRSDQWTAWEHQNKLQSRENIKAKRFIANGGLIRLPDDLTVPAQLAHLPWAFSKRQ